MRIALLSLALGAVCACSSPSSLAVGEQATVALDAFSGLPNPTWNLTDAQLLELEHWLSESPPTADQPLPDPVLGYRGFSVRIADRTGSELTRTYVAKGLIWIEESGSSTQVRRDTHGIEDWLIEQARQRGHGDVFDGPA